MFVSNITEAKTVPEMSRGNYRLATAPIILCGN
jgi:hypothetical protein